MSDELKTKVFERGLSPDQTADGFGRYSSRSRWSRRRTPAKRRPTGTVAFSNASRRDERKAGDDPQSGDTETAATEAQLIPQPLIGRGMIGVVGGGIAGLSAAYRLQQRGHDVRVFEASEDLGGLAATYETDGDHIEKFYHHLSKSEETIVELAGELGLEDDLEWRIGKNAYYVDGVVHPLDTAWQIAAYPHMSLYDTFRLGMLALGVDVRGGVPSFDAYERLEDFEGVPIEEFVVDHTTRGVYENFVEPLLDAKFGDRKDDVSAAWLLGRVKFRGERDILHGEILGYFDGGFGRLLDALVDAVGRDNIATGTRVSDIDTSGGTVSSLTATDGTETTVHDVDSVVVATMPNVLEALTGFPCDIDFQGAVCRLATMSSR